MFVSIRERPQHSEENPTPSLRVVDLVANDSVRSIIDDGCISCFLSEMWRQDVEVKMKVLGLPPIWLHKKETTFNGLGTTTTDHNERKTENSQGRHSMCCLLVLVLCALF